MLPSEWLKPGFWEPESQRKGRLNSGERQYEVPRPLPHGAVSRQRDCVPCPLPARSEDWRADRGSHHLWSTNANPRARMPGGDGPHSPEVPCACLLPGTTPKFWPTQELQQETNRTVPVLHTLLLYYGEGENATFSTTATSKIYPKNNSVQNRSVSEFKKKKKKKKKTFT